MQFSDTAVATTAADGNGNGDDNDSGGDSVLQVMTMKRRLLTQSEKESTAELAQCLHPLLM